MSHIARALSEAPVGAVMAGDGYEIVASHHYRFQDMFEGGALKAKLDPVEARAAALAICARATSLDDARDLLAMAGLLPDSVTQPAPVEATTKPGPYQRTDDRIAALHAQGLPPAAIAERLGIQTRRVTLWRERVAAEEDRGGRAERFDTGWEGK